MKKILTLLVILAIVAGGYYFWKYKDKKTIPFEMPKVQVITYKVVPTKLITNLYAIGTLQANESTMIRSEVAGKVDAIPLAEGQPVSKGELLLQLNDTDYMQDVERAKAAYELAVLTYDRNVELAKTGAVTGQSKDESAATMMIKKADYESSKIRLEKTKIVAPFDGVLGVTDVSIGDYLNVGSPIITISAMDPILVQFSIPQNFFSKIKQDDPITLTVDAWPDKNFAGSIYAIDPQLDVDTRTITVKGFITNDNNLLRPGMFAHVTLPIGINNDALLIPEEALIPSGEQISVLKVIDGIAHSVKVNVGVRQNSMAEIIQGLQPEDIVISAGQLKVREGMPVQAIPSKIQVTPSQDTQK